MPDKDSIISFPAKTSDCPTALLQLMRLSSPGLPIGTYAYSQGMEYAVAQEWITSELQATEWIAGLLEHSMVRLDVPVFAQCYHCWVDRESEQAREWSHFLLINRESMELQQEDRQQGQALARLLFELEITEAEDWIHDDYNSLAAMFALAASQWKIALSDSATGYLWSWAENQVAAAMKLVPLGQTAGQRILSHIIEKIPHAVQSGLALSLDKIGNSAPGLALASARHEIQYSRLFRS